MSRKTESKRRRVKAMWMLPIGHGLTLLVGRRGPMLGAWVAWVVDEEGRQVAAWVTLGGAMWSPRGWAWSHARAWLRATGRAEVVHVVG